MFFNFLFKYKPPEMVSYWKRNDVAKAKMINQPDGSMGMKIDGEKYIYPGLPRGHVLTGPLAKLKHTIKNRVFNQVFDELGQMVEGMKIDMTPPEKMVPAVRELWRVLQELEDAEVVPDMKGRIRLIKLVLTFFFQEDDAYRFRFQWVIPRLDMKKIKLTRRTNITCVENISRLITIFMTIEGKSQN